MAISDLKDDHIKQLIEMVPVVYKGTENTIVPVLKKIRKGIPIDSKEKKLINTWGIVPDEGKGGGYKADMFLAYIIVHWFKGKKLI